MIRRLTARDARLSGFRFYDLFVHAFVVVLLISNLVGQKICAIPLFTWNGEPFVANISGAQLLFPLTYIFGDIFTEVYGYGASRRAIWIGFAACAVLSLMGLFVVWIPAAPDWQNQAAFEAVFYTVPRFIAASLVAFWLGEFTNSYTLAKMKLWTEGRHLWARTIGSTATGQLVDTTVLMTAPPAVPAHPRTCVDLRRRHLWSFPGHRGRAALRSRQRRRARPGAG